MDRRNFLLAGLAGLTSSTGFARQDARLNRLDALLAANRCSTRGGKTIPAAMTPRALGELRYQGTHILTYGAFRDLATVYRGPRGQFLSVQGGGCDDGMVTVRRGSADLGGMCCPIPGSRAEGLPWLLVARDIKVAVVHPDNQLSQVGLKDLRAVARGQLTRWRDLGGENKPIALVVRKHCPDYFEPVRQLLLDKRPEWSPRGLFVERDEQIVDLVSRYRGGLGLVSWAFAKPLVEVGKLKVLNIDGVAPTAAAVQAGHYPLHGPLAVVYRRWEADTMRPFFDFLYGPQGAAIIGRALVPVSAKEANYRPARWI